MVKYALATVCPAVVTVLLLMLTVSFAANVYIQVAVKNACDATGVIVAL